MKKIYLLLVAVVTVMTFMACHKEKEEKDPSNPNYPNCSIPPYRDFGFHIDKEDSVLVNFKNELSIIRSLIKGKKELICFQMQRGISIKKEELVITYAF